MNLWRKFEEIVKPWMLVLAFILLLMFGFYKEAKAEVTVELGPTFLSGEFSKGAILAISEDVGKYRIGMGLTSSQEVVDRSGTLYDVSTNLFVHGQRIVKISDRFDFGLGVGYFNAKTRWNGSNFVASLSIEYRVNDNWSVNFRHFSNGGSATPNMGQDAFTVGYTF